MAGIQAGITIRSPWPIKELDENIGLELLAQVRGFILAFEWCEAIRETRFVCGFEYVVIAQVDVRLKNGTEETAWVVAGDISPAYFDDSVKTCSEVIDTYCYWVDEWVSAVRSGGSLEDVMPFYYGNGVTPLSPTEENAELLESRGRTMRAICTNLPAFSDSGETLN